MKMGGRDAALGSFCVTIHGEASLPPLLYLVDVVPLHVHPFLSLMDSRRGKKPPLGLHITSPEKFTSCFYHTSHVNVVLGEVAGRLGQLGDIGTFAEVQLPQMLEDACEGNTATQVIVIHPTGKLATAVTIN